MPLGNFTTIVKPPMIWEPSEFSSGPYSVSWCPETKCWYVRTCGPYNNIVFLTGDFTNAKDAMAYVEKACR